LHACLSLAEAGIGNDRFAFFATTGSQSRLNFLALPRAGRDDYVINQAALASMRDPKLPKATIGLLTANAQKRLCKPRRR
jgi:hypothetical protein